MESKKPLGITIFSIGYFYIAAMMLAFLFWFIFETFASEFSQSLVVTAHSFLWVVQIGWRSFLVFTAVFLPLAILFFVLGKGIREERPWAISLSFFVNGLGVIGFPALSFLSMFDADLRDWHTRVILFHGAVFTFLCITALGYFSFFCAREWLRAIKK